MIIFLNCIQRLSGISGLLKTPKMINRIKAFVSWYTWYDSDQVRSFKLVFIRIYT